METVRKYPRSVDYHRTRTYSDHPRLCSLFVFHFRAWAEQIILLALILLSYVFAAQPLPSSCDVRLREWHKINSNKNHNECNKQPSSTPRFGNGNSCNSSNSRRSHQQEEQREEKRNIPLFFLRKKNLLKYSEIITLLNNSKEIELAIFHGIKLHFCNGFTNTQE